MMNMKKKAFTIVEVQFAVLIAAFLIIAIISSYVFFSKAFSAGNVHMDVYSNSRIAMSWMAKDIKWAAQVLPNSTIGSVTYNTSDNCVVLNVPFITGSGDIATYDQIVYRVVDDKLHRIVCPSTGSGRTAEDRVIASHCLQLAFSASTPLSGGLLKSLSYFVGLDPLLNPLQDINTLHISLPLNEETVFAINPGGASLKPTTVVKLRNKQ